MTALPRVVETTCSRVFQEFNHFGPERCLAQISSEMELHNPVLLEIVRRWAWEVAPSGVAPSKILAGYAMFYRMLLAQWEPTESFASQPNLESEAARSTLERAKTSAIEVTGSARADLARQFGIAQLHPLPCVTPETRDRLKDTVREEGADAFTLAALENMKLQNPELLQMAHDFADLFPDSANIVQGFALLYGSLARQAEVDRARMH